MLNYVMSKPPKSKGGYNVGRFGFARLETGLTALKHPAILLLLSSLRRSVLWRMSFVHTTVDTMAHQLLLSNVIETRKNCWHN